MEGNARIQTQGQQHILGGVAAGFAEPYPVEMTAFQKQATDSSGDFGTRHAAVAPCHAELQAVDGRPGI